MLKEIYKYIFVFLIFLNTTLWSQIPIQEINVDIFPYLDILISRAKSDIPKIIFENKLNERIAITRFESSGIEIEDKYRTLIIKSFEEIREENKFFHLVGSIEALNRTVVVDSTLELYTPKELEDMERYSLELNANYYSIINLSLVDKTLTLALIVRDINDHKIVWAGKWSTIFREGNTSFNVGFYPGVTFGGTLFKENMFPFYFHFGIDWKIFTFVDLGFFLDPGANILFPSGTESYNLGFGGDVGVKIAIDMINIFNVLYSNLELPLHVRFGFKFNYNLKHIYPSAASIPIISMVVRPGMGFIISRNYSIFIEFDPFGLGTGEMAVYVGFYYRFEF